MTSPVQTLLLIDIAAGLATLAVFGIIYQSFKSSLTPRRAVVEQSVVADRVAYFDRIY